MCPALSIAEVPVVIETFTFLGRIANRGVALAWKDAIDKPGTVTILPCELRDLEQSWEHFRRADLRKLVAVDATGFAVMKRPHSTRLRVRSPLPGCRVQGGGMTAMNAPRLADSSGFGPALP